MTLQKRNKKRPQMKQKKQMRRANSEALRWLLIFYPVGLLMMWMSSCTWRRSTKSLVSLASIALTICLFALTAPPAIPQSGLQYAYAQPVVDFVGPKRDANAVYSTSEPPPYIPEAPIIVEPTPAPEPYYVFANDGGQFYHKKGCRYVRPNTPQAPIIQAVDQGFKRCKTCKAPKLTDIYGEHFYY